MCAPPNIGSATVGMATQTNRSDYLRCVGYLKESKRVTRTHLPRQCCGGGRIISITYIMKNATTKHVGWLQ